MNAKWLKDNALVVGFIAVFVLILGGVIWLQQQAASKKAEVSGQLEEQVSQLDHLRQQKPAPDKKNIEVVKEDRAQVEQLYDEMLANVSRNRLHAPPDLKPVAFLQLMASQLAKLRQSADTAKVKLIEGFAFGFGRYAGTPPTVPARNLSDDEAKKVVTQLVKQLRAIEKISSLLIESGADDIISIRRSEVEPGTNPDSLDTPISTDPKVGYETLPFEFQFHCTQESLRDFLNALTKSDWFFTVRRIQVVGEPPPPPEKNAGGATAATPATPADAGPKVAHLLVTVRIDFIEFPSKAAGGKGEAGKPEAGKPDA